MSTASSYKDLGTTVRKNHSFSGQNLRSKGITNLTVNKSIQHVNLTKPSLNLDESRTTPHKNQQNDSFFKNKVQRRYSDREQMKNPYLTKSPSPSLLTSFKYQSLAKSFKKDPIPIAKHENVFFELIKQQLKQANQTAKHLDLEAARIPSFHSQRRGGAIKHYYGALQTNNQSNNNNSNEQSAQQLYLNSMRLDTKAPGKESKSSQNLQNLKEQISILQNTLKISNKNRYLAKIHQVVTSNGKKIESESQPLTENVQQQERAKVVSAKNESSMNSSYQLKFFPSSNRGYLESNDSYRDDINIHSACGTPQSLRLEPKFFGKEIKSSQSLNNLKHSIAVLQNTLKNNTKTRAKVNIFEDCKEPFLNLIKEQLKQVQNLQYSRLSSSSDDQSNSKENCKVPAILDHKPSTPGLTSSLKKNNNMEKKKYKVRFKRIPQLRTQTGESSQDRKEGNLTSISKCFEF